VRKVHSDRATKPNAPQSDSWHHPEQNHQRYSPVGSFEIDYMVEIPSKVPVLSDQFTTLNLQILPIWLNQICNSLVGVMVEGNFVFRNSSFGFLILVIGHPQADSVGCHNCLKKAAPNDVHLN